MTGKGSDVSVSATGSFSIARWHSGEYWSRYPPSLPPDYYAAIGEICQRWAWLEFQCGVIAREVLRLDKPAGFALMGGMALNPVAKVLIALSLGKFLDSHQDLKERLNKLGTKLAGLGDYRNEYAHGLWGYKEQADERLGLWRFKSPEERMEPKWIHKTLNEMREVTSTLKSLQENAQQLTRDLKGALRGK